MIGPNPETMLITWATQQSTSAEVEHTKPLSHTSASYLDVIVETIAAAVFIVLTAGEVEAKLAGSVVAVGHELGTERVVYVSTGIPHDAGPWCESNVMTRIKGRTKGISRHERWPHLSTRQRLGTRFQWWGWLAGFLWGWPTVGPATNTSTHSVTHESRLNSSISPSWWECFKLKAGLLLAYISRYLYFPDCKSHFFS